MDNDEQQKLQTEFDALYAQHGSIRRVLFHYVRATLTPEQERAVEAGTMAEDRIVAMMEFCTAYSVASAKQPQSMILPPLPGVIR